MFCHEDCMLSAFLVTLQHIISSHSMKKRNIICASIALLAGFIMGCKHETTSAQQAFDTIPMLVNRIQQCSRLYTMAYQVHKIVTHNDQKTIKGSLFNTDININLPFSKREVAIPMDATIKAYINFEGFNEDNIERHGKCITIKLPNPHLVITSTEIDHKSVREYVSFMRADFTDAELAHFEQKGRQQILKDLEKSDILEYARISATRTLVPILQQLGYEEKDITITFSNNLQPKDIPQLIDKTNEHGK